MPSNLQYQLYAVDDFKLHGEPFQRGDSGRGNSSKSQLRPIRNEKTHVTLVIYLDAHTRVFVCCLKQVLVIAEFIELASDSEYNTSISGDGLAQRRRGTDFNRNSSIHMGA